MVNKKITLLLLAMAGLIEIIALVWIRGDYRSTMLDGSEYQVPAHIEFKGDFYHRNYLPVTVPITEAPGRVTASPRRERKSI